jgi:hypothetical protein
MIIPKKIGQIFWKDTSSRNGMIFGACNMRNISFVPTAFLVSAGIPHSAN